MNKCNNCLESSNEVLWHVNGYDIMRCPRCHLVYANVSENDISNAYEMDYYKSVYPDYESDRNIHLINDNRLLTKIEEHFKPGNMLEIGSAFGFFLESARKRGWEAFGYEISEYATHVARKKYCQDVRNENFLTVDIETRVDVICMLDTIEHLFSPSLYLEKISGIIKKDGGLIITTGDISSQIAQLFGKRWRMIAPPLHVYYYSRNTISRLLEKYGFHILSISHLPKYYNLNS